jgi:hypothetical protein
MWIGRVLCLSALLTFGSLLSGAPVVWTLNDVVFDDGTTVTGSFTFDADTTTFSGLTMTTLGGTSVPATSSWVFNTNNIFAEQNASGITGFEAVDALSGDETGAHLISLFSTLGPLMTNAGGTINLDFFRAGTCADATCFSYNPDLPNSITGEGQFVSGASVPEPGTWVLSGSALVLAIISRRRYWRP